MPKIIIYSKTYCPYCVKAKNLFNQKKVEFQEINIEDDPKFFEEMQIKTNNARTVPQILIDDKLIGGCDDLYALEDAGELDKLLI